MSQKKPSHLLHFQITSTNVVQHQRFMVREIDIEVVTSSYCFAKYLKQRTSSFVFFILCNKSGSDLSELFQNVTGVRFFETQCSCWIHLLQSVSLLLYAGDIEQTQ